MIEVKINGVAKWQVNEYTFNDPQMGIRSINMTVKHPSMWVDGTAPDAADFTGAYVDYEGEKYSISSSKPTAEKSNTSLDYIYTLIFKGEEEELTRRKVRNLALVSVDNYVSQGTRFSIYADINQFAQLIETNLAYYFGTKWTVTLSSASSGSAMVEVNNMSIWDLLLKTYEYYGVRWKIYGHTIDVGYTPDVIQHSFDYGHDGGLVKITRTAQSDPTINRLVGVGGSRNVPINYFTDRYPNFPVDPNPIGDYVNLKNVMPKVFRDSVIAGVPPYIDYVEDSSLVASDGVKEDSLEPNEEIYPSIAGVEVAGIGRIDQIIAASVPIANTPDDAGYSPTFDIWVKDIGFDLSQDVYTSTQDAKISFTSGMLSGYEFVILAEGGQRSVVVDTSKSYGGVQSKYRITLINSSEEYQATGQVLPNTVVNALPGDSFVILDIIMPQTYVELAELRLQNWLEEQLAERKTEKPTYAIDPISSFFEEYSTPESDGKTIKEKLKSGNKLTVNNTRVTNGAQELHINNITIQYGDLLPKYSFVVTDKVTVQGSVTQRIQSSVKTVEFRQNEISNKVGEVYSTSHAHNNKSLLDLINQGNIDVLSKLFVDESDNLYTTQNFYSHKSVSAFGLGSEGGGGGGSDYERLDTWASYDSSKAGWVLSAFLGNDLNTRVTTLEQSAGSGSVTSVGISVPTGLSVSNSPITSSGVIAISLQAGYSIPTTVKQGQWDTAFTNNHTHSNKTVLDGITSALVNNWNTAFTNNHTHSNKTVLDGITSALVNNWNTAFTNNHTHSNKTQLDLITQSNIDVLARLSIVNGNLQINGNAYATGELSAYGVGTGGGGGGGIIDTVYGYGNLGQTFNNSVLTDTFNAYTINQINTRLVAVESGSALTVNTTGTGNAITSISKAGSVITAHKDLSFLETSIFNTHNNDNVRHITGAERTKWDGVVTDFAGLEIGGRNLAQLTNSKEWGNYGGGTISFGEYKGITTIKSTDNGSGYIGIQQSTNAKKMLLRAGEQYTISLLVRGTVPLTYNYIMNTGVANRSIGNFTYEQPLNEETFVKAYLNLTGTESLGLSTGSYFMTRPTVTNDGDWVEITQLKIEKGTKATDWAPAPEDQVSDWLTTDVNSFSFIKNKPTLLSQFTDNIGVATHIANTSNPHSVTKAQVGLGNVDNTSDTNKPISTATQTALNLKANLASPTFSGTVTAPTLVGNIATFSTNITVGSSIITGTKIDNWDEVRTWWQNVGQYLKRDATNQALYTDENFYSTKEVSAYGIGSGGGSGGGIIETVYGYGNLGQTFNNSILTDTFNAYTINQLHTRLSAVESGAALSIVQSGTGNAVTSVTKSGTALTVTKGLNFSQVGHTHSASDITSGILATARLGSGTASSSNFLRGDGTWAATPNTVYTGTNGITVSGTTISPTYGTAVNTIAQGNDSRINNGQTAFGWGNHASAGYALNSAFNTHNNDNVRHITGAERTKWDGVVTDFAGLEIGGRNLTIGTSNEPTMGVTVIDYIGTVYDFGTHTFEENQYYTLSIDFKTDNNITYIGYNYLWGNDGLGNTGIGGINVINDGVFRRYSVTFRFNRTRSGSLRIAADSRSSNVDSGVSYYIKGAKLEKGNKATDWTPAPEDQVSDWNTTDVNSFSFIKNKPTSLSQFTDNIGVATHIANTSNPHSVTKAQVGLGNVDNTSDLNKPISTAMQTALNLKANLASPTFTGTVTAPTFIGSLNGNATSATALQTARTIWGQSFKGDANVSGAMTAVTTIAMTGGLSGATTIQATISVTSPKVIFNAAGWSMEQVGDELQMKHNNVLKMRFTSTGSIVATEEITAFG